MDFGPGGAIVVITLADIGAGRDLVVSTGDAHHTPVADTLDWGIKEGHHWAVWVQVHNVELQLLLQIYQHHICVF